MNAKVWCGSLTDNLHKFFSRSWQERGLFIEAFLLLAVMRAAILLLPFRRITAIMGLVQGAAPSCVTSAAYVDTSKIGWAIQAAAARTPWESACLAQALTGMLMLSRRRGSATLYLGVAKDESGSDAMAAHAWLKCGDMILTGVSGYEAYSVISSFHKC